MSAFPLKLQFFVTYGVLGCLGPITALFLRDAKGFSPRQIGITLALSTIGMLVSPAVMAWLADREVDTRKILRFIFVATAGALVGVHFAERASLVTTGWAVYSILFIPVLPLLDGYYFNHERAHGDGRGGADGSYQFVRVWGTIGFMVPAIAVYFIIDRTGSIADALWCGVAWCGLSFASTFLLAPSTVAGGVRRGSPTLRALRVLVSKRTLPMCIGLFFVYVSASAYYPVVSVFFNDEIGIPAKWISPLMALGVAIEIAYIFGLGPIRKLLRIRGIMIFGLTTMSLRLAMLAFFPTVTTSVLIQLFHGLEILAMFVVPVIYLDRVAGDGFRNSIQGAWAILVNVPTRVIGFVLAGEIGERLGSTEVLYVASSLAGIGALLILLLFKPQPPPAD